MHLKILFTLLFLTSFLMNAQEEKESLVKQIAEHQYQLQQIKINTLERMVSLPATVNMQKGLIEVFLCSKGGKTHESIFVTDVIPYYMQVALLMVGLKQADTNVYTTNGVELEGDRLQVYVEWIVDGEPKRYQADELVWNLAKNKPMKETDWIFIGSREENGKFMADDVKSLITTYNDWYTIIDNPMQSGQNDELYSVNEKRVPSKGTEVSIIIQAL